MGEVRFGGYRLERLLGKGGMGQVWLAYDTAARRRVALKLLPAELAAAGGYRRRFEREAAAVAALRDPHVPRIHRFGEIDGRLYIDMQFLEGRDLAGALATDGPMTPQAAVGLVGHVAAALDSAHRAGLVHRDVKPSNILVHPSGFAYLIDFGIAHGLDETAVTTTGMAIGTLGYMAPERFTGSVDGRADVYSLACVLYECLTGSRPYGDTDPARQMHAHLMTPPPRASSARAAIPVELDAVIVRGLAKDPGERFRTAGEFAAAARVAIGAPAPASGRPPEIRHLPETLAMGTEGEGSRHEARSVGRRGTSSNESEEFSRSDRPGPQNPVGFERGHRSPDPSASKPPTKVLPQPGPPPTLVETRLEVPRPSSPPRPGGAISAPPHPAVPPGPQQGSPNAQWWHPNNRRYPPGGRYPRLPAVHAPAVWWRRAPAAARPPVPPASRVARSRPRRRRSLLGRVVVALVVVFLTPFALAAGCFALLAVGTTAGDPRGGAPSSPPAVSAGESPDPAVAPAAGAAVRDGKFEFVVTRVEPGVARIGWQQAAGSFLVVTLTVRNVSDEVKWFLPMGQRVFDAQGAGFAHNVAATMWQNAHQRLGYSFELQPGRSATTQLVFDLPAGSSPDRLELHDFALSRGVQVRLG